MVIEIKNGIKSEYICNICGVSYIEQRNLNESQFFIKCQNFGCSGDYELVSETEFTYEQYIEDPIIEEPINTEIIEEATE